ncbi:triple tyrosine motif-containing protein [Bacteroides sp.]|uniref:triple tyrosine motif-containing protein n=1 Tax=Bacteroides sp. TaxID=29523 RepID=UPI0025907526|nr:triple tyrosine motif-containing protein [Bacteroides sp.]
MLKKKLLYIVILLLGFYPPQFVRGEESNHSLVINLPKSIYQAENKNWSIEQDELGFLYFGNDKGLLQFDGSTWTLFQQPSGTLVRSLSVVSNKKIYTGTFEDFGYWLRDDSGKLFYTSLFTDEMRKEHQNDDFWRIVQHGKFVYFQSFSSIFVYDQVTVTELQADFGFLLLNKVNDELYVQAIGGGIYQIVGTELKLLDGSSIFSDTDVRIILPYKEGLLVGTSYKGFFYYVDGKFVNLESEGFKKISSANPNVGIRSRNNTYYIGTLLKGLYEIDEEGAILENINTESNLQNNTVLSLFQDNMGDIWLGLDGGISYLQKTSNLSIYIDRFGQYGSVYGAILWNDYLLLATNQRVFAITLKNLHSPNPEGKWISLANTEGQSWGFKLINGTLYCFHNRGLKIIDEKLNVSDLPNLDVGVYDVFKTSITNGNKLLIGSYTRLYIYDEKTKNKGLIDNLNQPVSHIEMDHLGNIWLEHPDNGVYRCRFNECYTGFTSIKHYGKSDDIPYRLRFFKLGGKVELYGNSQFFQYNELEDKLYPNEILNELLKDFDIKKVIPIDGSNFFILSKRAIVKLFYDGYKADILNVTRLNAALSLVNKFENAEILDVDNYLIGLDNGFLIYHDDKSKDLASANPLPLPRIYSISLKDKRGNIRYINTEENLKIPFSENSIQLKIIAPNQFNLDYDFFYKLSKIDNSWQKQSRGGAISYDRLPVGDYMLNVKCHDSVGKESAIMTYYFKVRAPWYATIWALLLYFTLIIVILVAIWTLILRRYRNQHIRKIRLREIMRLRSEAEDLLITVESKNAELLTMTSFIVYKNELITKLKDLVDEYYKKNKIKALLSLTQQMDALINQSVNPEDDWKVFLIKFEEKHADFFVKLKELYPDLTSSDLRLCACLKLNMDTKEIASLMSATVRSIENKRYRLRKKMNLDASQNLNEYLIQF